MIKIGCFSAGFCETVKRYCEKCPLLIAAFWQVFANVHQFTTLKFLTELEELFSEK